MSNPFAAPVTATTAHGSAPMAGAGAEDGPWRDGDVIVHARTSEAPWPARCCKCNAPTDLAPIKLQLQWNPRWVFALALIGPIFLVIGMLATRWQGVAMVHLCPEHAQRRTLFNVGLGVSVVVMLGAMVGGIVAESLTMLVVGMVALVPLFVFAYLARTVVPEVMDERWARLKGADARFVASLPEWRG